jgi:AcrR family transcriptional regulator
MGGLQSTGSPGNGRKTERGRRREGEVQTAATALFHEQGYEGTSVEDIARALGILKGSLYYYISSKEDLLFQIVSEVHADVQGILDEALGHAELSPLERLALYVRKQAIYNVRNVTRIAVYYREMDQLGTERRDAIRAQRRVQHKTITEVLKEAQAAGEVAEGVDVGLASHSMFATINWIYTWWRPGGTISEDEVADSCVSFVLGGIPGFGAPSLAA